MAQAAWSPDGGTLAFLTHSDSTTSELWLMDADGEHPRRVGSASGTDDDAGWGDIAWSSDDWILFVAPRNQPAPRLVR